MLDGDSMGAGSIDEGLARRLKALACTAPLHDLDARKTRLDWADASAYQMAEVALQVIDQVTIAMDFDRGAGHEQVVARVRPFVAARAPDRGEDAGDEVRELESRIGRAHEKVGAMRAEYRQFTPQDRSLNRTANRQASSTARS